MSRQRLLQNIKTIPTVTQYSLSSPQNCFMSVIIVYYYYLQTYNNNNTTMTCSSAYLILRVCVLYSCPFFIIQQLWQYFTCIMYIIYQTIVTIIMIVIIILIYQLFDTLLVSHSFECYKVLWIYVYLGIYYLSIKKVQ